jgi:hypothetical protein
LTASPGLSNVRRRVESRKTLFLKFAEPIRKNESCSFVGWKRFKVDSSWNTCTEAELLDHGF